MVDTTRASEGKYVNADMVKKSATKRLVIINEGEYVESQYGEKLQFKVEIDFKQKVWSPNTDSLKNLQMVYGMNSDKWVGKIIILSTMIFRGKEVVNGVPYIPVEKFTSEVME